jgi:hypothetical protein
LKKFQYAVKKGKSGCGMLIGLAIGLFFCWLVFLFIKGFIVTESDEKERAGRSKKIIGEWKTCAGSDTCVTLTFDDKSNCVYKIVAGKKVIQTMPCFYEWKNETTKVKGRRGRTRVVSKENEFLVIKTDTLNNNWQFESNQYTIVKLTKDSLVLKNRYVANYHFYRTKK